MMRLFGFCILMGTWTVAEARWLTREEAGSYTEFTNIDVHAKADGSYVQEQDSMVKLLSEDAKSQVGVGTLQYNGVSEQLEILEAYTLNGKDKHKVEATSIEDREKGESRDFDRIRVVTISYPKVIVGSRLYLRYRLISRKPFLEGRWSDFISAPPNSWMEKLTYRVKSERPLFLEVHDPEGVFKVLQSGPNEVKIELKRHTQAGVHGEKSAAFHPDATPQVYISTHKDWSEFFAGLNGDFEKVQTAGLPPILSSWLKQARGKKNPEEQLMHLLERIAQDFRYFGDWRRQNGGYVPRSLKDIEQTRYGDCKDLSSLLVALARGLGLKAHVALIRRGDNAWGEEPDYKLPNLSRFNHAIARVEINQRAYWLDPTNPVASLEPYMDVRGRPVFVLDPTRPRFERVPVLRPEDYRVNHVYEYQFKDKDLVQVRVDAQFGGVASYRLASDLLISSKAEVLNSALEYFTEGQDVRSFAYAREPKMSRRHQDLDLILNYEAGRVLYGAGAAQFFILPDMFLTGAMFETQNRESDVHLTDQPYALKVERRLKNARLAQPLPERCVIQSRWVDMERTINPAGKDLVIQFKVEMKKPYVLKSEYRSPEFLKLQREAKDCFFRTGVLVEVAA